MNPDWQHVQHLFGTGDSFAAVEAIQREGTPLEIAAKYQSLLANLYWKARDLPAALAIGRAGILYCLGQSLQADISPEMRNKLRSVAKGLAYDIGSFTWPGWEEPGIAITEAELAIGRDCARLNLRLALELQKPPDRLSMAHWLIGAHALAAKNFDGAEKAFEAARKALLPQDDVSTTQDLCNAGFLAIARWCKNVSDVNAQRQFEEMTFQLAASQDSDAKAYLDQLRAARRLFVPADHP